MRSSTDAAAHNRSDRNLDRVSVQEAIVRAGGYGKYQCFLLFVLTLANNATGLFFYGVPYYELDPTYLCSYNVPQFIGHEADVQSHATRALYAQSEARSSTFLYTVPCEKETVCAYGDDQDLSLVSYRVNTDDKFYIENWIS